MNASEVAAYDVLSSVFDANIIVCPKVRLAELVEKFKPEEHQIKHWSKVTSVPTFKSSMIVTHCI